MSEEPNPHARLWEDVELLGELLWDAVGEHEGPEQIALLEEVKALSHKARNGLGQGFSALYKVLDELSPRRKKTIARAFAQYLMLSNIAEQHHRVRRRRDYLHQDSKPQRGSLEEGFESLLKAGVCAEDLRRVVLELDLELVLTAHPTEINRRTLLQKHAEIAGLLAENDRPDLIPAERRGLESRLRRIISCIWFTDEIPRQKPSPLEEANSGLLVFEQALGNAIPQLARHLDHLLSQHTGSGLPLDCFPLRFGSWMGGDRDGNPNVTPEMTRMAVALGRWMAADLYCREVDTLRAELSLNAASQELFEKVGLCPEPYRVALLEIHERLGRTRDWAECIVHGELPTVEDPYLTQEELREPLMLLWRSLHEVGAGVIAQGRLLDILRRLSCFGLTLVRLDIRQESSRHTAALDAVTRHIGLGSYEDWNEERRVDFLVNELENRRPLIPRHFRDEPDVHDVLETMKVIAEQHQDGLGAYVISMATTP
ncbi:MAG: phosphoenolpyruvate carboxylase, partial [Proteobacteria bacterium]|nr:phosphoenolpyruvate carboxylase [Pseudomonadota bacterium]